MKLIKPTAVLGTETAKELGISPVSGGPRPQVSLKVSELERCFRIADQGYLPNEAIAALDDLTTEYVLGRQLDSLSATPGEAHEIADEVHQAVKVLRRAVGRQLLDPFLSHDLSEALDLFDKAETDLRAKAGHPQKGGATGVKANRRRRLADGLVALFREQGWPDQASERSLMTEVFRICLDAAAISLMDLGVIENADMETVKKPQDLLKAASMRPAD